VIACVCDIAWVCLRVSCGGHTTGAISFREYYKKTYGAKGTMTGTAEPGLIVHFLRRKRNKRKGEQEKEEEPPIYLMPELGPSHLTTAL
jgi:hypothetical protein